MSDFKQAISLKKQGVSNRRIAEQLGINKETVNNKFAFITRVRDKRSPKKVESAA